MSKITSDYLTQKTETPSQAVLTARATHRARILPNEYPDEPDADGQGAIIEASPGHHSRWRTTLRHYDGAFSGRADLPEPLASWRREATQLERALSRSLNHETHRGLDEWLVAEFYLRSYFAVISFQWIEWDRGKLVCLVTRDMAARWGLSETVLPASADHGLADWLAYRDGDVWDYVIEERTHWQRTDPGHQGDTREDWDEVESGGNYYGREHAEEAAHEALNRQPATALLPPCAERRLVIAEGSDGAGGPKHLQRRPAP
jgi:hypothetical protein